MIMQQRPDDNTTRPCISFSHFDEYQFQNMRFSKMKGGDVEPDGSTIRSFYVISCVLEITELSNQYFTVSLMRQSWEANEEGCIEIQILLRHGRMMIFGTILLYLTMDKERSGHGQRRWGIDLVVNLKIWLNLSKLHHLSCSLVDWIDPAIDQVSSGHSFSLYFISDILFSLYVF